MSDDLCCVFKASVLHSRSISRHDLGYKQGTLYGYETLKKSWGDERYPAITRDGQRDLYIKSKVKKLLDFGSKQTVKLMGELKRCIWRKIDMNESTFPTLPRDCAPALA